MEKSYSDKALASVLTQIQMKKIQDYNRANMRRPAHLFGPMPKGSVLRPESSMSMTPDFMRQQAEGSVRPVSINEVGANPREITNPTPKDLGYPPHASGALGSNQGQGLGYPPHASGALGQAPSYQDQFPVDGAVQGTNPNAATMGSDETAGQPSMMDKITGYKPGMGMQQLFEATGRTFGNPLIGTPGVSIGDEYSKLNPAYAEKKRTKLAQDKLRELEASKEADAANMRAVQDEQLRELYARGALKPDQFKRAMALGGDRQKLIDQITPSGKVNETAFTKEMGKKIAQDAAEWISGGKAKSNMHLAKLDSVSRYLGNTEDLYSSLPIASELVREYLPDSWKSITKSGRKFVENKEIAQSVAAESLKSILGGQFAKIEGENLLKRLWNDSLGNDANKRKLQQLIDYTREVHARRDMISQMASQGASPSQILAAEAKMGDDARDTIRDIIDGKAEGASEMSGSEGEKQNTTKTGVNYRILGN